MGVVSPKKWGVLTPKIPPASAPLHVMYTLLCIQCMYIMHTLYIMYTLHVMYRTVMYTLYVYCIHCTSCIHCMLCIHCMYITKNQKVRLYGSGRPDFSFLFKSCEILEVKGDLSINVKNKKNLRVDRQAYKNYALALVLCAFNNSKSI